MSTNTPLKWEEVPVQHRAAQKSEDSWSRYKTVILDMDMSMTLNELMKNMKDLYGFQATYVLSSSAGCMLTYWLERGRQYTYRLAKWRDERRSLTKAESAIALVGARVIRTPQYAILPSCNSNAAVDDLKRSRSVHSIGDESSQGSTCASCPSKKVKADLEERHAQFDSDLLWEEGFSVYSASAMSCDSDCVDFSTPTSEASSLLSQPTMPTIDHPMCSKHQLYLHDIEICQAIYPGSTMGNLDTSDLQDFHTRITEDIEALQQLPLGSRLEESKTRLSSVADYLYAIGLFEAAADFYLILLTDEESRERARGRVLTPLLTSAIRSAHTQQQCKLVQDVLLRRWSVLENADESFSERFLGHMFLARTYLRQRKPVESTCHLKEAWCHAENMAQDGDILLHPSLDLMVYLHYTRICLVRPSLVALNPTALTDSSSNMAVSSSQIGRHDFAEFCSSLRRGKTERYEDHANMNLVSRCLRQSLAWCVNVLYGVDLSLIPKMEGDKDQCPGIDSKEKDTALFKHLWRLWHEHSALHPLADCMIVSQYDDIGISTAEHLFACAELINRYGVINISTLPDLDLEDAYLRQLYDKTTFVNEICDFCTLFAEYQLYPSSTIQTMASSIRSSDDSLSRLRDAAKSISWQFTKGTASFVLEPPSTILRNNGSSTSLFRTSRLGEQFDMILDYLLI